MSSSSGTTPLEKGHKRTAFKKIFGRPAKEPSPAVPTSSSFKSDVPTPIQPPPSLWDKAIAKVPLSDRNVIDFGKADRSQVLKEVKEAVLESKHLCELKQWKFRWKGKEIVLRDVAGTVIDLVEKFAIIGDLAVQYDPGHAAIPWTGFRLILQLCVADAENLAHMLVGLEKAANCIDRCAIYERLYLNGHVSDATTELSRAIVELYAAILIFQTSAIAFYRKNTTIRGLRAPFDAKRFQESIGDIDKKEKYVQIGASLVEAEYQNSNAKLLNEKLARNHKQLEEILANLSATFSGELRGIAGKIGDLSQSLNDAHIENGAKLYKVQLVMESAEQERLLEKLDLASGAKFDSRKNEHRAQCLENTRVDLLQDIQQWKDSDGPRIFWLNGMAGTGKSTIAKTIARLAFEQKRLGASFFFARGSRDLGSTTKLITTIAFQLAEMFPILKLYICEAIKENSDIAERGLRDQWNILVFQPLNKATMTVSETILIVFDALDECDGDNDVRLILQLLEEVKDINTIRLRVLLTSRPELPIRLGFRSMDSTDHRDCVLHSISKSVVDHDISLYYQHEFKLMRKERNLPEDWPEPDAIDILIQKADRLFIYAATTCRFVKDPKWVPQKRLSVILQGSGSGKSLTRKLDDLYIQVLNDSVFGDCDADEKVELAEQFRDIVGSLVILFNSLSMAALAKLLGEQPESITPTLDSLHSVVDVPEDSSAPIRIIHLSFHDFLLDKERCLERLFWVDERKQHSRAFERCLVVLSTLKRNICNLRPGSLISDVPSSLLDSCLSMDVQYACQYWFRHLEKSDYISKDNDEVHRFLQTHFLHWLEALSLMKVLPESIHMITGLQSIVSVNSSLSAMVKDFRRFILANHAIIGRAPLQVYFSAIALSPYKSIIRETFSNDLPEWIVVDRVEENWKTSLQTLEGHEYDAYVEALEFSPDGKTLTSASDDWKVNLWDTATGLLRDSFEVDSGGSTSSILLTPNARLLVTFEDSDDAACLIKVWHPVTGVLLNAVESKPKETYHAISPNGQILVSTSKHDTKTLKLWELKSGNLKHTLSGHRKTVKEVVFSYNSKMLASGSSDSKILLWNVTTGELQATFDFSPTYSGAHVKALTFSPDDRYLASASSYNVIYVYDIVKGIEVIALTGHTDDANDVVFSPNGTILASASDDRTIKLWDWRSGSLKTTFDGHTDFVLKIQISPDGKFLASASSDSTIKLWDMSIDLLEPIAQPQSNRYILTLINEMCFSPDGKLFASASMDGSIKLWDPTKGLVLQSLEITPQSDSEEEEDQSNSQKSVAKESIHPDSSTIDDELKKSKKSTNSKPSNPSGSERSTSSSSNSSGSSPDAEDAEKLDLSGSSGTSSSSSSCSSSSNGSSSSSGSADRSLMVFSSDGKVLAFSLTVIDDGDNDVPPGVEVDGLHLETELGLLELEHPITAEEHFPSISSNCELDDDNWITWRDEHVFWLPAEYRGDDYTVKNNIMAQSYASGDVKFFKIDGDALDRYLGTNEKGASQADGIYNTDLAISSS